MAPSAPAVEMRSFGGNDLKVHVVDTAAPYETVPLDESSDLSSGKGAPICGASGDYGRSYLTFENLSFKVRADQRSRDIRTLASSLNAFKRSRKYDAVVLEGVSGHLAPGSLTLLLGGPRSGKSTLLKILAGRTSDLKNGTVGGQVRINGAAPDETYRRRVTLVEQADVHYPLLTVRETLRFAGSLRTPREGVTEAEVDRKADEVLARLNLTHTADTIVGNQAIRGISGGEKRRLTIACEAMAGGNTVMLLDQASDGLDATATLELCRSLRRLAEGGMAIMACLLQPSWEAFCCFDNVLMLAGGRVAYAGPRGGAIGHFEGLGYGRPEGMTPQDFLQWVTEHPGESMYKGPGRPLGPRQFADAFAASPAARLEAGRREEAGQAGRREAAPRVQLRGEYAQPFGRQFRELFGRYVKLLGRNPGPNVGRFVTQICLLGFVLGTLYCQMPRTLRGAMNRVAFLQAAVLGFGFLSLSKTDGYFQDRAMLYKEDLARYYRPVAWYLAILLAELPRLFLEVLVFSCITYWAGGLQGADGGQRFGKYILALFLMSATSDMTTFAVVAWTPVVQIGAVVASIIPPIYLMFNGFLVPKELIPKPWIWMHYFSFYRYPHEALTISELHDLPLDGVPAGGRYVLEYFTLNTDTAWYWYNMAIMFGQFLFYVSIGLAGFTYRRWPKSFQAPLREEEEDPDDAPHAITMAAHPGASMAHFAPPRAALTFKELSYAVTLPKKAGGGQKTLLHKISGFARSGELCALMGPSGGGKTTLLDVLADRKTGGAVAGELLINGTPRDNFFLRISGYVEQFDLLYPTMTVREAVALSARLRLEGRSEAERDAAVTAALECLHLVHHAGEMVGSPATGGIPVALRKKLSIAMELVTQPSILFLDEPTTGLDAVSAMQVVQLLHELAAKGQAIICTIHQPSAELIKSFDSLLLLKKGGEVVYSGPMGPACRDVLAYFARLGFPCPDTRNPADHLLDVIQGKVAGPKGADAVDFAAAWAGSPEAAEARAQLDALNARASDCTEKHYAREFATGLVVQTGRLVKRQLLHLWRDPQLIWAKLLSNLLVGFIIGTLWVRMGDSQPEARMRTSFIFSWIMYTFFRALGDIPGHFAVREVFYRERSQGLFRAAAHWLAHFIVTVPFNFANHLVFAAMTYWIAGMNGAENGLRFAASVFFIFEWQLFSVTFCECLSYLLPVPVAAQALASTVIALGSYFAGFMIPNTDIPRPWVWMYYLWPFHYTTESLIGNEMLGLTFRDCDPLRAAAGICFMTGDQVVDSYGFDYARVWPNVGYLAIFWLFFEALKVFAMHRVCHLKR